MTMADEQNQTDHVANLMQLIQGVIDQGATSVEEVHQSILAMPLDAIAKFEPFQSSAASVKDIQSKTLGTIYDTIRSINKSVSEMAPKMLQQVTNAPN